jgi:thioredoxin-related protein
MKKLISLSLCLMTAPFVDAQQIEFNHGTWAEVKAKAKAEKKLIFVDAYTTWCGPCKAMAKNTFTKTSIANYYNSNFINAKIDMEKGEGIEIAKQYNVNCYPNLLYIDADGNLVHRGAGYLDTTEFLAMAKTAQSTDKNFATLQKQYTSGNASPAFVGEYFKTLAASCLSASDEATVYLKKVKETDLILPENWRILYDYIEDIKVSPFIYLVENRSAFAAKYTADSVDDKIFNCYLTVGIGMARDKKTGHEAIEAFKTEAKKSGVQRADELGHMVDLSFSKVRGNWNNYFAAAKVLVEKYKNKDANFINSVSWTIFEKSKDKTQLAEAELWSKRCVQMMPAPAFLDTYACLLYKNGKKSDAIITEKKAIELGLAEKQDVKEMEETLKKFEENKP